jgi:hypothetical protein
VTWRAARRSAQAEVVSSVVADADNPQAPATHGSRVNRAESRALERPGVEHRFAVARGALYRWPIDRQDKVFRMALVEVGRYDPPRHASLFDAALAALTTDHIVRAGTEQRAIRTPLSFDLATFPEAFLPVGALLSLLRKYSSAAAPHGFIHVGLRADDQNHLLSVDRIHCLLQNLRKEQMALDADLRTVSEWLAEQPAALMFNMGCVFGIDAENRLRLCLHPKLVRSKMEMSALPEHNMHEASLISVVALEPTDPSMQVVHLQPLLCSDALFLDMDQPARHPIRAISSGAVSFACLSGCLT